MPAVQPLTAALNRTMRMITLWRGAVTPVRYLAAAIGDAASTSSHLLSPLDMQHALGNLSAVVRVHPSRVDRPVDQLLDIARATAAESIGLLMQRSTDCGAIQTAVDVLVSALDDNLGGSLVRGSDKRALPESAALSLLQLVDAVHVCKQARRTLTKRFKRVAEGAGPDRYVLGYAIEALKKLSVEDPALLGWLLEHLVATRWCPRTSATTQY